MAIAERTHRVQDIMDAFGSMTKDAPITIKKFSDLAEYHRPSRDHVLGVAFSLADSAMQLGLDPHIAVRSGIRHDLGKRMVRLDALNGELPRELIQHYVREPHMYWTRIALQQIPAVEFGPLSKQEGMAIDMAHHDVLPNRSSDDYYPRHRNSDRRPQQFATKREIFRWQILLALHDKANRFSMGYDGQHHMAHAPIVKDLQKIVAHEPLPFSHDEMLHDIETVARSTSTFRMEELDEAYQELTR